MEERNVSSGEEMVEMMTPHYKSNEQENDIPEDR